MKTDSFLGDKAEYIEKLAAEVANFKGVLQDISQQMRRIERRIDFALPEGKRTKGHKASAAGKNNSEKPPTMSEVEARKTIDQLTNRLESGESAESIQSELRDMTMKRGLTPIAREFGMTNTKLPPKSELILNIITRLRQSVMLTENIRKMSRVAEEEKHFGD